MHFARCKSHARTSLREVVVDPIAGDTLGEKQSTNQSGRKRSQNDNEHIKVAQPAVTPGLLSRTWDGATANAAALTGEHWLSNLRSSGT